MRRDVLFLDLALEAASRGVVESAMGALKAVAAAAPTADGLSDVVAIAGLGLDSASRSLLTDEELDLCLSDFRVRNLAAWNRQILHNYARKLLHHAYG